MKYNFSELMEMYWGVCYKKEEQLKGIEYFLSSYKDKHILDCACGSGVLTIDLIQKGYDISCSDGSAIMINVFREKAKKLGLNVAPLVLLWSELPVKFNEDFDLILCRGNSIVYASLWDSFQSKKIDDYKVIKDSIEGMYKCLKLGGVLYIDIPSENNSDTVNNIYPSQLVNNKNVEISEKVVVDIRKGFRLWEVDLKIEGVIHNIKRYSYILSHEKFFYILKGCGFKNIKKLNIEGERLHYSVFTAEK